MSPGRPLRSSSTAWPVRCPSCRGRNAMARALDGGRGPEDGDIALCFTCGEVMVFDLGAKGGARQPVPAEQVEIEANPDVGAARAAWKMLQHRGEDR